MLTLHGAPGTLKCKYKDPGLTQHLEYANSDTEISTWPSPVAHGKQAALEYSSHDLIP
jgi:hypothetical protein